ncbi:hypothetical protein [Snuella lapsa]|uniref:DUF4398 domain-containing protein n=1 Tax=Snuella lapsa TaxID=870481 RepID=A0ABP6YI98_9FLAO
MKKHYLFFVIVIIYSKFQAQEQFNDVDSDLVYAYSHVKSAYKSNNITHLKYYANRSLEAFKRAKPKLKACNCETAYDNAYDGIELLAHVDNAETFEDGRFYVKRARDLAKQSIIELDKCTVGNTAKKTEEAAPETLNNDIATLQHEQNKLKEMQEELRLKGQQIKAKIEEQKQKELDLKKEQLINSYNEVIATNIKTYNELLETCNCKYEVFKPIDKTETIKTKSVEEIKTYFVNGLKDLTSNYLSQLELCDVD